MFEHSTKVPEWCLDSLYKGRTDNSLLKDFDKVLGLVAQFEGLSGRVSSLSPHELLGAIKEAEAISELVATLSCYAFLSKSMDQLDREAAAFHQKCCETVALIQKRMCFFELEINSIDDLSGHYKDCSGLLAYEGWLGRVRRFKPYQLPLESEGILLDKSITSSMAWSRLFSELHASYRYDFRGERLLHAQIAHKLSDQNESVRRDAAQAVSKTLKSNAHILTYIMNNIIKDKGIEDNLRGFVRPISSRNLDNNISDEVVDVLIDVVKRNYGSIAHRYYRLKAQIMGKNKLEYWDRNAPIMRHDMPEYSWDKARHIVTDAYREFSPKMADICDRFFAENRVDALIKAGKDDGAFCCSIKPGLTPYILLNFQGKTRDVYTLAHEIGHGIHYVLSAKQTMFLYDVPLTFAETASIFGEFLLFRKLIDNEQDKKTRALAISEMIENMINSTIRQIAFCEFEITAHEKRKAGELSSDDCNNIWMHVQSASLGEGINLQSGGYENFWSYIPHFIHSPFYVYAYAFGNCLVNALYATYKKDGSSFVARYESMLSMGGNIDVATLHKQFGFDLTGAGFWQAGLDVIAGLIDELESTIAVL